MKNRAKMISLLMAVCMMLTLLPAAAFAAGTKSVNIGSVTLNASRPYYHNGTDGEQGTADNDPTGANATFDATTGTLTLNNLHIVNKTTGKKGIQWSYSGSGANDLIIILPAGTNNIVENTKGAAINGEYGWQTEQGGGSLTITGSGALNVVGSSYGIWVWHNVIIEGDVTVNVTGTSNVGIANNNRYGKILIKDNAKVTAHGGKYGIGCDTNNNFGNTVEIQSGSITVTGDTAAFMKHPDTLGTAVNAGDIYVNDVTNDVAASEWDENSSFNSYKYVGITSTRVTTYEATYHSNDGEDAEFVQVFTEGTTQNLKDNRFDSNGLTFEGWNTKADGSGTAYADKQAVVLTDDIDLYAQWEGMTPAPKTYRISFNRNTQDAAATGTMEDQIFTEGVPQAIKANAFSVPGYVFTGWNTEQNGGGTSYDDEEVIFLNEDIMNGSSGLTLYAQWEMDAGTNPGGPTIKDITDPDTNDMNGDIDMTDDDIIDAVLTDEEKNGDEDIDIFLTVENIDDTVDGSDKDAIEEKAGDKTVAAYLDISLFKKVGSKEAEPIPKTKGKIKITIVIPDNIFDADRTYYIIYRHDGETKELDGQLNSSAKTFSFEANEFSTYALAYTENSAPASHSHSHIDVWYIAGNSFGTSKSAVPTGVEIDGVPVGFTGDGREFTVSCIPAGARRVTVRWGSTSVSTNFTPDVNSYCTQVSLPKTGDASIMAYALMAVMAAAGAMGKK